MPKSRVFLFDAYALLYRAHFAFIKNPRRTSKGMNTSAIFGFANTLLEIINKENPTHVGVAFDTSAPTFRHIEFPEYKAQRDETPEDLIVAKPYTYRLLKALNIPALQLDGFEADDIIGTVATQLPEDEYEVYMVTPDKDYAQLVKDNVFLYRPSRENGYDIIGKDKVKDKFGVEAGQITDFLGMMGDSSDNIPGIPKIGEKTAISLIEQFGNMENMIAQVDTITKNAIRETVKANSEKGILSKHLATIKTDVAFDWTADSLKIEPANMEDLSELMAELEFRQLAQRLMNSRFNPVGAQVQTDLFGNAVGGTVARVTTNPSPVIVEAPSNFKTLADVPHDYKVLNTAAEYAALVEKLSAGTEYVFDTETTSLDTHSAKLVGLSFSNQAGEAFYIPCPEDANETQAIVEAFRPVWESKTLRKIAQNLKYDMLVLRNYGIQVCEPMYDTMLAHYVFQPEAKHGMDDMAMTMLNYRPISFKDITANGKLPLRQVAPKVLSDYAAEDADITWQLYQYLSPKVKDNKVFEEIEMPLVPVLAEMEHTGICLDKEALNAYSKDLETRIEKLETDIQALAGLTFNVSSPAQLGVVLFEKLKLGKGKKTKSGQYSTDEEVLQELAINHELPGLVLAHRGLKKLKSTYVDALPLLINPKTGRVHTTFSQSIAVTGRLSSVAPNLQNIPIRSEDGREVRKSFIPGEKDFVLLSADYSQVELRIMAAFCGDPNMIAAFQQGEDIHRATAARVFGVSLEEVTSDMRSKAKTVNFGIIYGVSAFGLARQVRISRSEAKQIIDTYFEMYPAIKKYMDDSIAKARTDGYVETYFGRRRYLSDITSANAVTRGFAERNAINSPIQGTAADVIKIAMIRIHDEMKQRNLRSRMLLQVHDELVFEVHQDEIEEMKTLVSEKMNGAISLVVPMEVGVGIGKNWLEAH